MIPACRGRRAAHIGKSGRRRLEEWLAARGTMGAQTGVSAYLHVRRKQWGISVFVEQRIRVSPTRYRVPDVCVTLGEPEDQVFTEPPFLCVEILSPDDRASRIQSKIADYLRLGVRYIWVIDRRRSLKSSTKTSAANMLRSG